MLIFLLKRLYNSKYFDRNTKYLTSGTFYFGYLKPSGTRAAGWCLGEISRSNTDGRRTVEKGVPANFFVYYEIDDDESKHALALAEHGHQEVPGAWVLLEREQE